MIPAFVSHTKRALRPGVLQAYRREEAALLVVRGRLRFDEQVKRRHGRYPRPPLNTLGGTRWAKAKAHAESAVRDVASELLSIQAARDSQAVFRSTRTPPGSANSKGVYFEETPDQMRAIVETKDDMERPKPMDRLICGDVGFGKTEVGIRAAFKAVMDGKQVAVLVPTTVLAQQHFNTFRERMADYPVRVELLSRFRTRRAAAGRERLGRRRGGHRDRHASADCRATLLSKILAWWSSTRSNASA